MPVRGERTAPKFAADQPRELGRYFEDLTDLFTHCAITDHAAKKKYAVRYLDVDSAELWSSLESFTGPQTFVEFTRDVYALYPGSENDRKWSIADVDKLVGEQLRLGIMTASDLGTFHRAFLTITTFLVSKGRMSGTEQSRAFIRGFQPELWKRVQTRLELKFPDRYPDDPLDLADILEAAKFVLHSPVHNYSLVDKREQSPSQDQSLKKEDLSAILNAFAQTIATALSGKQPNTSSSATSQSNRPSSSKPKSNNCFFCESPDHFSRDCTTLAQYLTEGKVRRNSDGKIVLPNGSFCPRSLPGDTLQARVDEWHRRNNPIVTAASQMMYSISPPELSPPITTSTYTQASSEDRIRVLEQEIFALRNGKKFDGVEVPRRKPQSNDPKPSSRPNPSPPTTTPDPPAPLAPVESTAQEPVHPFAEAAESHYRPPQNRNFGGPPPKPSNKEPAYRSVAPIQNPQLAIDVFNRSMKTPCVTLTHEELYSIAPEVRFKVRDAVSSKRIPPVSSNLIGNPSDTGDPLPFTDSDPYSNADTDDGLPPENAIIVSDPYETYISTLTPGTSPKPYIVAKDSMALRSVMMHLPDDQPVESILDPGSQIVAMSEAVCHHLGLAYDPSIQIHMQSANGEIDPSLGLARNVACKVSDITLYLQIHVIRNPAYDILLGRPFDVLTQSVIRNYSNEDQTITIQDPNSGRISTIPTIARNPPRHHMPSDHSSNFFRLRG